MFGISVSKKRNRKPVTYSIGNDITLTSWGAIKVFTTHFFPSGFRVKTDSIVIYGDFSESIPPFQCKVYQ